LFSEVIIIGLMARESELGERELERGVESEYVCLRSESPGPGGALRARGAIKSLDEDEGDSERSRLPWQGNISWQERLGNR
jgi:hypothetical protein